MKKLIFFQFTLSICMCYISYSVILGFAALFLQRKGFDNTSIGVFFALSALFCVAMQFFSGSFLDNHPKLSVRLFLIAANSLIILAGIPLYFSNSKPIIFICYIIIDSVMLLNSSLYNTFGMEYINNDIPLNYSLARGCASFLYAISALIIGFIIEHTSVSILIPIFIFTQIGLVLITLSMKSAKTKSPIDSDILKDTSSSNAGLSTFLKNNKNLLFMFISILLIYSSYTSVNNFQINIVESVGGNSSQLGTSTFIAALMELPAMALFIPLSKRVSYKKLLIFSCTCLFIKVLALSFATNIFTVYLCQSLQFFSYGLFVPASAYYINQILPESDMAKGQTALGIFTFGLSGILASVLSGILLDFFSVTILLRLESLLAFLGVIGVVITCKRN